MKHFLFFIVKVLTMLYTVGFTYSLTELFPVNMCTSELLRNDPVLLLTASVAGYMLILWVISYYE